MWHRDAIFSPRQHFSIVVAVPSGNRFICAKAEEICGCYYTGSLVRREWQNFQIFRAADTDVCFSGEQAAELAFPVGDGLAIIDPQELAWSCCAEVIDIFDDAKGCPAAFTHNVTPVGLMFDNCAAIRVVDNLCDPDLSAKGQDIQCSGRVHDSFLNDVPGYKVFDQGSVTTDDWPSELQAAIPAGNIVVVTSACEEDVDSVVLKLVEGSDVIRVHVMIWAEKGAIHVKGCETDRRDIGKRERVIHTIFYGSGCW